MAGDSGSNVLMFAAVVAVSFALFNLAVTIDKVGDVNKASGFAVQLSPTEQGEANLTILGVADVNFTKDFINWSVGGVNTTCGARTELETSGAGVVLCGSGFQSDTGLILRNQGNQNVSVNLQTSNNATSFIPSPDDSSTYEWTVTENLPKACAGANPLVYADVNFTAAHQVCPALEFVSGVNELRIDLNVTFTSTAVPGARASVITATATTV